VKWGQSENLRILAQRRWEGKEFTADELFAQPSTFFKEILFVDIAEVSILKRREEGLLQ